MFCTTKMVRGGVNPDIVIIQIGENMQLADVVLENGKVLKKQYMNLLTMFQNSQIIATLPFWPEKNKINTISNLVLNAYKNSLDISLVDLSHLGTDSFAGRDELNFARSVIHYENSGVGAHPSDIGMKRIAENIFLSIR